MTFDHKRSYNELLRYARRVTKRGNEAEDLLQSVLLAAVEAGRTDIASVNNGRWIRGALRRRALFDARTAARRKRRESSIGVKVAAPAELANFPLRFVRELPPRLRTTALLALTGHTKAEIGWLLKLSDSALRQRIAAIRRRWRIFGGDRIPEFAGLRGPFAFGRMREALLKPVRRDGAVLASHDPDGHLFLVTSQNGKARQLRGMPNPKKE